MNFDFATATRIVFGPGAVSQLSRIAKELGATRPLVVTGRSPVRAGSIVKQLRAAGMQPSLFPIPSEPTVEQVRQGVVEARAADMVISIGGGSAIDGGKAIAALAKNEGDVLDYLEVIGRGKPLEHAPLPYLAIPTTAGTGSEVTRNAVLGSREHGVKVSLRSPLMLAKAAIVDSELTLDLPPEVTASSGLDALTQLIEPFVSRRANAITDMFCLDGLRRAAIYLPQAYRNGSDRTARENMSMASLCGGLALANAGLGVVHGFASPIGGRFEAPHGAVCAALLAAGMSANIRALREREPENPALERYGEIARILTGGAMTRLEDGVEWVRRLSEELRVAPLRTYGVTQAHVAELVEKAAHASSMKANPIVLTTDELTAVLESAL
jgi:alcohol dehydrogenase class IV